MQWAKLLTFLHTCQKIRVTLWRKIEAMEQKHIIGIIPARYASTRFPGKPLAMLGGKPVIEHVYGRAYDVLDGNVIVATDDERIRKTVENFGGKAVMTSTEHRSGTDRCYEAYCLNGGNEDVVINIQGDEPFVHPSQLRELISCFEHESTEIGTLVRPFPQDGSFQDLQNPNMPKVVVGEQFRALYFSRSVIPYLRGVDPQLWPRQHQYYTHIGLYGYRSTVLEQITRLPQSPLEKAESLEQLRWLENDYHIRVGVTMHQTIGIDTPQDLERAELYLNSLSHD